MPLIIKFFVQSVSGTQLQLRAIFHEAVARAEDLGMVVQITEQFRSAERQKQLIRLRNTKNSYFTNGQAMDVLINNGLQADDCKRFSEIVRNVAKQYGIAVQWSGAYEN